MIPLGLSATGLAAFTATLADHHAIRVSAAILTLDELVEADISGQLTDGQVNVDYNAEVTRSARVTLLDPSGALSIDSRSPADASLYLDRMLQLTYSVAVAGEWVPVPIFTGPITAVARNGDSLDVQAQGKEALALSQCWTPFTIRKGIYKTDAIRMVLSQQAGETRFSIPREASKMPVTLSLARGDQPWPLAVAIARSMARQLYYDGAGVCRLRGLPGTPLYSFTGANLTSPLQISFDSNVTNVVWVTGATPKISYTAVPPYSHPLSPHALGRNGVNRYLLTAINDANIRSVTEARRLAEQTLANGLLQSTTARFDALPVPHLDPGDPCTVATEQGAVTFRLSQFSLPLRVGQEMSVGYLRNITVAPRRRTR